MNNYLQIKNKLFAVYVESSSYCNLRCSYCHRTLHDYIKKNANMHISVFKTIIDKLLSEGLTSHEGINLFLHGFGEPTFNPELEKFVSYASSKGVFSDIQFVTNLTIKPYEYYTSLFDAGLTKLFISFDGTNQRYVESTRCGTNYDDFINTFKALATTHASKIVPITVLTSGNSDNMEETLHFFEKIGIHQWNIQLQNEYNGGFSINKETLDSVFQATRRSDIQVNLEGAPYPTCSQPLNTLVFNAKGDMAPCCTDFSCEHVSYGSVINNSITSCLSSQAAQDFLSTFFDGSNALCSTCAYYGKK